MGRTTKHKPIKITSRTQILVVKKYMLSKLSILWIKGEREGQPKKYGWMDINGEKKLL